MNKGTIPLALLAAMLAITAVQASEFDGGYVGFRFGANRSNISGTATPGGLDATTLGIDGGYNRDMQTFLLGVDVFADFNNQVNNYGSDALGVDIKLGLPHGNWLPYARLGYANTNGTGSSTAISGGSLHDGLGIEFKYTPNWGINAELSSSSAQRNGSKLNNDNFTIGLRYYWSTPSAAPILADHAPTSVKGNSVMRGKTSKEVPESVPIEFNTAPVTHVAPLAEAVNNEITSPQPPPFASLPKESLKSPLIEKPVLLDCASFATRSAKLLKSAGEKLNEVVNVAKRYPDMKLEVSGHTDNRNKLGLNQKLSENRAAAVKAWLVMHGVAADRISAVGYADAQPITDNKTEAGRAANRRVEVRYVVKEER